MKPDLKYLRWATLRQMPFVGAVAVALMALVLAATYVIPLKHNATARLLVETRGVSQSGQVTNDGLTDAAHLQNIENRLLTQTRLAEMAQTLGAQLSADQLRNAVQFDTISGRGKATTLTITVKTIEPVTAINAANILADKVVAEHRTIRVERAESALQFFRSEVADSMTRMNDKLSELLALKTTMVGALPGSEQALLDHRKSVLAQLADASTAITYPPDHQKILNKVEAARTLYSDKHPKVQQLLSQLAKFDQTDPKSAQKPAELAAELARVDAVLKTIPTNELRLNAAEREHSLAEKQYEAAIGRLETAAIEERIAVRSNGDRLSIVERATMPDVSTGPKQQIVLAMGLVGSILVAAGLAFLKARHDPYVRRAQDLENGLGLKAYAVIPPMATV